MADLTCPYCGQPAEWVSNDKIYGRRYGKSYMIWLCLPCRAYVGCHHNTQKPLGTMANKELREWRIKAHAHIDPLWRDGEMRRSDLYKRLNALLGRKIHIGESDIALCQEILTLDLDLLREPPKETLCA